MIDDQVSTTELLNGLLAGTRDLSAQMAAFKASAQQMEDLGQTMDAALRESQASIGKVGPVCTSLGQASDVMTRATDRLELVLAMLDDPEYRTHPSGV